MSPAGRQEIVILILVAGLAAVEGFVVVTAEAGFDGCLFHRGSRGEGDLVRLVAGGAVGDALFRLLLVGPELVGVHCCYLRFARVKPLEGGGFGDELLVGAVALEAGGPCAFAPVRMTKTAQARMTRPGVDGFFIFALPSFH
jgi:hypothetical protein